MIALFGYIAVKDTPAAQGMINAFQMLFDNADDHTTSEFSKIGFRGELAEFITSTFPSVSS